MRPANRHEQHTTSINQGVTKPLNIPAQIGTRVENVDTPCLLIELDAYERNLKRMADFIFEHGL